MDGKCLDLVIVGGGIAGLVAAGLAAQRGASVRLVEAGPLGGRARTRVAEGFCFNQGPHALYADGALRQVLADLGVAVAGRAPGLTRALALWGDDLHPLPLSTLALARLTPFGIRDRLQLAGALQAIVKGPAPAAGTTLADWLGGFRPKVAAMLAALMRLSTYANAPALMAADAAHAQARLAFTGGVLYLDGGWQGLVDGLVTAARAGGAVVDDFCRAVGVTATGDGWRVALADGTSVAARRVVLATPPAAAADLLPGQPALAAAAAAARPIRAVCLDLALAKLPNPERTFVLGIDAPLYFSVHSATAALAPAGAALVHAAWYLADGEAPAASHITRLEAFVDRVQPGWRGVEAGAQRLMGMAVANDMPRAGLARAAVAVAGAPGLFLAGDWVGDAAMLSDASAASARRAVDLALGCAAALSTRPGGAGMTPA